MSKQACMICKYVSGFIFLGVIVCNEDFRRVKIEQWIACCACFQLLVNGFVTVWNVIWSSRSIWTTISDTGSDFQEVLHEAITVSVDPDHIAPLSSMERFRPWIIFNYHMNWTKEKEARAYFASPFLNTLSFVWKRLLWSAWRFYASYFSGCRGLVSMRIHYLFFPYNQAKPILYRYYYLNPS